MKLALRKVPLSFRKFGYTRSRVESVGRQHLAPADICGSILVLLGALAVQLLFCFFPCASVCFRGRMDFLAVPFDKPFDGAQDRLRTGIGGSRGRGS